MIFFRFFRVGSLRDTINSRILGDGPPLGEVEALVMFAGVCRGAKALHDHKPSWAHRQAREETGADEIPIAT